MLVHPPPCACSHAVRTNCFAQLTALGTCLIHCECYLRIALDDGGREVISTSQQRLLGVALRPAVARAIRRGRYSGSGSKRSFLDYLFDNGPDDSPHHSGRGNGRRQRSSWALRGWRPQPPAAFGAVLRCCGHMLNSPPIWLTRGPGISVCSLLAFISWNENRQRRTECGCIAIPHLGWD